MVKLFDITECHEHYITKSLDQFGEFAKSVKALNLLNHPSKGDFDQCETICTSIREGCMAFAYERGREIKAEILERSGESNKEVCYKGEHCAAAHDKSCGRCKMFTNQTLNSHGEPLKPCKLASTHQFCIKGIWMHEFRMVAFHNHKGPCFS